MRSKINVIGFLRKFQKSEKEVYQGHLPLMLFPQLVGLGCSFLTSSGCLEVDSDLRDECFAFADLQDSLVDEVLNMAKQNKISIDKSLFNNSLSEMQNYYNGMIRNFMIDFSNDFGSGYHLSNAFDGFIESLHKDERDALTIYFRNLGFSTVLQSLQFLRENYSSEQEFVEAIQNIMVKLSQTWFRKVEAISE